MLNQADQFVIKSNDAELLERAKRIALSFANSIVTDDVAGIVFLGAIARNYFDADADIDVGVIARTGTEMPRLEKFSRIDGIEVQVWLSDYETELRTAWDMSKRWTYSSAIVHHDPCGLVRKLIDEKVPLAMEERKRLMMSGLTLSEWYVNRLSRTWVARGDIISAHAMIDQGLVHFLDLMFAFNDQLVPDMKWRHHLASKLRCKPDRFDEALGDTMLVHAITRDELDRRIGSFMHVWNAMKPLVEHSLRLSYAEMLAQV